MFRTAINVAILAALPGMPVYNPSLTPLAKSGTWEGQLAIGSDRTFNWTGGSGQIRVNVTHGSVIDDDVTLPAGTQSYTWFGTNRSPGEHTITVTDAAGSTLSQQFDMVYAYYIGYRKFGDGTTAPATTSPFAQSAEGVQTLAINASGWVYQIAFSKHLKGSVSPVSGGTTGATLENSNPAVATVVQNANGYQAAITPVAVGTTVIRVTTASGDATGILTVTVA